MIFKQIWPEDETLRNTTLRGQSGPGSNGNEGVFHTSQVSRTKAALAGAV